MNVFVYGTLRRGMGNHRLLEDSKLLAETETLPHYTMHSIKNWYPGVVEGGSTAIKGEVYKVDLETLRRLDSLEGHPHFYARRSVVLANGTSAWIYLYQRSTLESTIISSGDWNLYSDPDN